MHRVFTTVKGLRVSIQYYEIDPRDSRGTKDGWRVARVEARTNTVDYEVGYLRFVWKDKDKIKPLVDYSFVHENFRRRGLGVLLYQEAAKFCLGITGYELSGSTIQSPEVLELWHHMLRGGLGAEFGIGGRKMPGGRRVKTIMVLGKVE